MAYCPTPILVVSGVDEPRRAVPDLRRARRGRRSTCSRSRAATEDDGSGRSAAPRHREADLAHQGDHPPRAGGSARAVASGRRSPRAEPTGRGVARRDRRVDRGAGAMVDILRRVPAGFGAASCSSSTSTSRSAPRSPSGSTGSLRCGSATARDGERLAERGRATVLMAPPGRHLVVERARCGSTIAPSGTPAGRPWTCCSSRSRGTAGGAPRACSPGWAATARRASSRSVGPAAPRSPRTRRPRWCSACRARRSCSARRAGPAAREIGGAIASRASGARGHDRRPDRRRQPDRPDGPRGGVRGRGVRAGPSRRRRERAPRLAGRQFALAVWTCCCPTATASSCSPRSSGSPDHAATPVVLLSTEAEVQRPRPRPQDRRGRVRGASRTTPRTSSPVPGSSCAAAPVPIRAAPPGRCWSSTTASPPARSCAPRWSGPARRRDRRHGEEGLRLAAEWPRAPSSSTV